MIRAAIAHGMLLSARIRFLLHTAGWGAVVAGWLLACAPRPARTPAAPFADSFDRAALGAHYLLQGGSWRIVDGALASIGDHNQPLFLDVPLARNFRITFVAWSQSDAVDTKVEVCSDGKSHSSGYIVILGGWNNSITTIARLDEHEKGRVQLRKGWEKGRRYHWTVERTDGRTLRLLIDGALVAEYPDADPLFGPGNDRLAFTSWESHVFYDDLVITPL